MKREFEFVKHFKKQITQNTSTRILQNVELSIKNLGNFDFFILVEQIS